MADRWPDLQDDPRHRQGTQPGPTWSLDAHNRVINKKGQIEYLQLQVTVHTWPNRADTDVDGLNDSEELNLGSDGFSTDPWNLLLGGFALAGFAAAYTHLVESST